LNWVGVADAAAMTPPADSVEPEPPTTAVVDANPAHERAPVAANAADADDEYGFLKE